MQIRISPFAELDLDETYNWYELEQENLGRQFAQDVAITVERIKQNPSQFPTDFRHMQKALLQKFPLNIYFVIKDDVAYLLGFFHSSRNPKIMRDRYKNLDM